ncbi:hypothetical protein TKK_0013792 [Trichogramma kaykai]
METGERSNGLILQNNVIAEDPERLNSITYEIDQSPMDVSSEFDDSCDEVLEDNCSEQDWFYSDEIEEYSSDDDAIENETETARVVINEEPFISSLFLSSKSQSILSAITDLLHTIKGDLADLTELPFENSKNHERYRYIGKWTILSFMIQNMLGKNCIE